MIFLLVRINWRDDGNAGCHIPGTLGKTPHLVVRLRLNVGLFHQYVSADDGAAEGRVIFGIIEPKVAVGSGKAGVPHLRGYLSHSEHRAVDVVVPHLE